MRRAGAVLMRKRIALGELLEQRKVLNQCFKFHLKEFERQSNPKNVKEGNRLQIRNQWARTQNRAKYNKNNRERNQ